MARLPQPGADDGQWGEILNDFLSQSLNSDGELRANTVGESQLQENAVTADAIAPGAVDSAALASGAITKADVGLGNVQDVDTTNAVNITGGTLSDNRLPTRLSIDATYIADANSATFNGWYLFSGSTANSPDSGQEWLATVIRKNGNTIIQRAETVNLSGANSRMFVRRRSSGIWGAWERLRWAEAELDARYVTLTGDQTIAGTKTFSSNIITNDPSLGTHVATKQYVDTSNANRVLKAGDTMTGELILTGTTTGRITMDGQLTVSNGSAGGGISLGGNVNSSGRTDNTRKIGVISSPNYATNSRVEIFSFDSPDANTNGVYVGGRPASTNTGATQLGFIVNPNSTATGGNVRMLIDSSGNVGIGRGTLAASSRLHIYESSANVGAPAGLTIEQNSTGDSVVHFLLTNVQRWQMGIDNSAADEFVIGSGADWGTGKYLTISTTGTVAVSQPLQVQGITQANVHIGTTAPATPVTNQVWIDTTGI